MANGDGDERESKRRQLNSVSSLPNDTIDATVLQVQNHKLVQQLDVQKNQAHQLELNLEKLRDKQKSYNSTLISVHRMWNQLVEDFALLGLCGGGTKKYSDVLDHADSMRGMVMRCPAEEVFLRRLLQRDSFDDMEVDETGRFVEKFLSARCLPTKELMKSLNQIIHVWRTNTEKLSNILKEKLSPDDAMIHACKINDALSEEARSLHAKHIMYEEEMQDYVECLSSDRSKIKQLSGELDVRMAELEESRRKLVNLRMQKEGPSALHQLVCLMGAACQTSHLKRILA